MKNRKILAAFFICAALFVTLFTGCKKRVKKNQSENGTNYSDYKDVLSSGDYESNYYLPDEEEVVEYDDNGVAFYPLGNIGHTFAETTKGEKSEEPVVMTDEEAVKSLSKYKIKYETKKKNLTEEINKFLAAFKKESPVENEKVKNAAELKVVSWGPKNEVPALMSKPAIYVIFSAPVHVTTALEAPIEKCDVFTITPKVKGTYRWTGSRQLTFYPSERLDSFTKYTIQVNQNLKSIDGEKIKGETTFTTSTDYIRMYYIIPGTSPSKRFWYDSDAGVPLEYAQDSIVETNLKIPASEFNRNVAVTVRKNGTTREVKYTVKALNRSYENYEYVYKEIKEDSNYFYIHIEEPVDADTEVIVSANPYDSKTKNSRSYYSIKPFVCKSARFDEDYMSLDLRFNQPVNLANVKNAISFSPSIDTSKLQVEGNGRYVILKNLPVEYDSEYVCNVNTSLTDRFGQHLNNSKSLNFKVPRAGSYMKFLDTGNKIMEAQFPHKFIIEHQNLVHGSYQVSTVKDPLCYEDVNTTASSKNLNLNHPNMRVLDVIDLDPYLKKGLGFVQVYAKAEYEYWDYWDQKYRTYETDRNVKIQVTDLGVTARAGMNKVCVMVRKLSDNTPVSGATVKVVSNYYYYNDWSETDTPYATGKTDKNGFVEIEIPQNDAYQYWSNCSDGITAVFVQSGDDKVVYNLDSHNAYRFSVPVSGMKSVAEKDDILNFSFTDRCLYRPGETVSYRGIVRHFTKDGLDNSLAGYRYRVVLERRSWYDPEEYCFAEGYLSREGGYSGTFDLPDDIPPGDYSLSFYYNGDFYGSCNVMVAYFEKVKFQATAQIANVAYTLGESINAELMASYLAGGALTGATYDAMWYKQPCTFTPPVPEAENYVFGPDYDYNGAREVNECRGSVNENGPTKIKCDTEKGAAGQPYFYRAEIGVTDISNQTIYTGAAKVIHPGTFYIGLAKRLAGGFPEVKTKVEIPFTLFKPDGSYAATSDIDGNINYEISRRYWACVNEESVDGIYSRWVQRDETVTSGNVKGNSKGVIAFTPNNAGVYTIKATAVDKKGNLIRTDKRFYVTGNDYWWFDDDNAYALNLSCERNIYKPGETAKILLESPLASGDYMITVERNNIYSCEVRHFDSPCSVIEIPVKEEYLPVVYVSICSYSTRKGPPTHEYGQPDLDKPKGYYGVTQINVDRAAVAFKAELRATKKVYRPGEEVVLEVKATQDGKPLANAEFTLMVVDRAVIDLINYHVDDPLEYFYDRYRYPLCCVGGDSRAKLMDPVTYKVKTLQGGDEDGDDENKEQERSDFRPTALFEPAVRTDAKGRAIVKFKMPDNLTTYRVTAFGVKDNNFTLREAEIQVQNPINVMAVQPRRLRIRDTAECGVIVTNLDTKDQEVTVSLEIAAPKETLAEDKEKGYKTVAGTAVIDGESKIKVKVPAGRTKPIYFNVAAMKQGNINLIYHVSSDVLKEKLVSPVLIEKSYVYETVATTGVVESSSYTKNEKVTGKEKFMIPGWIDDDRGELQITLDPTQLGALGSSVRYVFDYPYGCLEQQSSRIWPMLIFGDYIDVFGLKSKVDDPRKVITSWFASVKDEQKSSGGFPYWPGGKYESEFVSIRFAHMYKLAIDRGYSKKEIGYDIDRLLRWIASSIKKDKYLRYANCYNAYCCYVFSLYGDKSLDSILNSIYSECMNKNNKVSLTTLGYCGLAYQNRKDGESQKRAKEIAAILRGYLTPTTRSVTISGLYKGQGGYWYGMYDSDSEALGAILQLFAMQNPHDEMVGKVLFALLNSQKAGYWQSTATTARVFESIYELIKLRKLDALDFISTAVIKSGSSQKTIANGSFKGAGAKPAVNSVGFGESPLKEIPRGKEFEVEFTKDGKGSLYYTAEMRYAIPEELHVARNEGLEVSYQITDDAGNIVTPVAADSKVIVLESGKTYKISVSTNTSTYRYYAAMRVPIPSGAEIVDTSLSTGASKNTSGDKLEEKSSSIWSDYWYGWWDDWWWDYDPETYDEYYDNEARFFNNYIPGGNWCKTVTIRAARKGVYPTPPASAELMYEPEVFGRADGYLFIIK